MLICKQALAHVGVVDIGQCALDRPTTTNERFLYVVGRL